MQQSQSHTRPSYLLPMALAILMIVLVVMLFNSKSISPSIESHARAQILDPDNLPVDMPDEGVILTSESQITIEYWTDCGAGSSGDFSMTLRGDNNLYELDPHEYPCGRWDIIGTMGEKILKWYRGARSSGELDNYVSREFQDVVEKTLIEVSKIGY